MTSATVAFQTLGCKLNFSETSTLARKFVAAGYERVPFEMNADVYVINTCSVTENADKKFTALARQTRQRNPDAFLIAVGCYAQLQPEELAKEDSVDLVLGAKEKFDIISYLGDLSRPEQTQVHACARSKPAVHCCSCSPPPNPSNNICLAHGLNYCHPLA